MEGQNPLTLYLLKLFNVSDIAHLDPFGTNYITSSDPGREVTTNVELTGNGRVPPESFKQPRNPFMNMHYNLDDVSVRTSFIRYVKNPSPNLVMVLKAYEPVFAAKEAAEAERAQLAMGGIPRLVMNIKPSFEGATNCFLIKETPSCIYLNHLFIKTFMHLDAQNLMNGIINIPPALCAEAGLPKQGEIFVNQESVEISIDYYVLVPYNHVLAWCLQIGDHWRRMRGLWALEMLVKPSRESEARILYYVVGNQTFDRIRNSCLNSFMNGSTIDRRRLGDVGVELVPTSSTPPPSITLSISYICFPHMAPEIKAKLMPKLPKDFPPYIEVLQAETTRNK